MTPRNRRPRGDEPLDLTGGSRGGELFGGGVIPVVGSLEPLEWLRSSERISFETLLSLTDIEVVGKPHPSHGFVRVAAGSPEIDVGNCAFNTKSIIKMMRRAQKKGVHILNLPELIVTGHSPADLFFQEKLRRSALRSLELIRLATLDVFKGVLIVGAPIEVDGVLFNCAVVMQNGRYLGIVPKSYLPTYGEFDESRWFKSGRKLRGWVPVGRKFGRRTIALNGQEVRMGVDLLFAASDFPGLVFGVEICEDGWGIIPPHRLQALAGAVVFFNLSASNELVGKPEFRRNHLCAAHSAQAMGAYVYASSGEGESTDNIVYGGDLIIAENGAILKDSAPLTEDEPLIVSDIDIDHLLYERMRNNTFRDSQDEFALLLDFERIPFVCGATTPPVRLERFIDAYPFVPMDPATRDARCEYMKKIQVRGLKRRFKKMAQRHGGIKKWAAKLLAEGKPLCVIGVSGGLDSTHALLVVLKTVDELGISRKLIHGYTMPGFGTTARTKGNADRLMELVGITAFTQDIRARCLTAWVEEGFKPFGIDLAALKQASQVKVRAALRADENSDVDLMAVMVADFMELLKQLPPGSKDVDFENKQARARTDLLMSKGFVIGTGDLSELAVGWCTYNADQMSMYNVNCSIPKTLVHFLVRWSGEHEYDGELARVLIDIAETEVSPELLPAGRDGKIAQKTNDVIGPADLRDFYFYHLRRWASTPEKIIYLAEQAKFNTPYELVEIRKWLKIFVERFFDQQYKRDNGPGGPKVGLSLNQRYDWHMPSDASSNMWLDWAADEAA